VNAICHVTDLVRGVSIDEAQITLEPVLPGFLRLAIPPGTQQGDEMYVTVKVTIQAILPG